MWVSDRRLYLTADERVVEGGDPAAATLLVTVGGSLPLDAAVRYGLLPPVDATQAETPAAPVAAPTEPSAPPAAG